MPCWAGPAFDSSRGGEPSNPASRGGLGPLAGLGMIPMADPAVRKARRDPALTSSPRLWQVAALVVLTALLLLPAVACVDLNSRPESWFSVMRMHASGSPGVSVMGMHTPGWATMLVALSLGFGLGVVLFRSGRRGHVPNRRPFATPADA